MPEPKIRFSRDLTMPLDVATSKLAVVGVSGSGKTTALAVICEELLGHHVPVVILDPTGAHWGLRSSADGKKPGYPVVIFGGRHADVPLEPGSGRTIAELLVAERIPAIVDLSLLRKGQRVAWSADFFEALYELNREPLHVVIDEAHTFAPQRPTPDSMRMLGAVEDVVLLGRIRGLGVSMATQRPALLHKNVLTQIETLVALRLTGKQDVDAVDDWINAQADPALGKQVKSSLSSQPTGQAWVWSPHFLRVLKQVQVRQRKTFDSSATPKVGQVQIAPTKWASIDIAALGEKVATAVETARVNDPKALRARVVELEKKLALAGSGVAMQDEVLRGRDELIAQLRARIAELEAAPRTVEVPVVPENLVAMRRLAATVQGALTEIAGQLAERGAEVGQLVTELQAWQKSGKSATAPPFEGNGDGTYGPARRAIPTEPARRPDLPTDGPVRPRPRPPLVTDDQHAVRARIDGEKARASVERRLDGGIQLRAGARRMIESLGRMYPLRLTKSQWGMVSGLKTSGGTWGTYLSDLRRNGLVEENRVGWTLTDGGFEFLGGRPAPMTPVELQNHYLRILRAGAARMLTVVMDAYPNGITRADLADAVDMTPSGGTFGTYLSDLRRNGLIEQRGEEFVATEILMHGAQAQAAS